MENKVTTRESLTKVLRYMSNEKYYKRFNKLFKEYIDPKNKDKNAFYYKLLQHLTDAGLTKAEAEEFFKDMRVKNAPLIQQIEESQQKIKESVDKFDKARFDLLTNPVNVKSYLIMFMETARIIEQTLNKTEKEFLLNVRNREHFAEKIKEIKELLREPKEELNKALEKEAGFDEVLMLQQMKSTFDKIGDKLGELGAELTTERTINEVLNEKNVDKEQGQEGKEKEVENPQAPAAATESVEQKDAYMLSDAIYKAELQLNTPETKFNEKDYNEKLVYLTLINYAVDKEALNYDTINFLQEENHNLYLIKKIAATEILVNDDFKETFNKLKADFNINNDKTIETMIQAAKNLQNKSVPLSEYNEELLKEMLKIDNSLNTDELKNYFVNNSYLITEKNFNNIVQSIAQQAPAETESPQKEQKQSLEDITFAARDKFLDKNKNLEKELINSLEAVYSDLFFKDNNIDEKTMNFLVLSEYLHAYNNFPLDEVYAKFDKIFDKDEFKAIVLYNKALQDNAVDDVFDFSIEEGFEAVNIKEYAKMLKHNFKEYRELDEALEKELEEPKKEEKELEVGAPQKNKKFKTLEI